jgi:hypothetical protein
MRKAYSAANSSNSTSATSPVELPYLLKLRWYQKDLWDAFVVQGKKKGLVVWPRRNGKDLVSLNITVAKSQQRVGVYLYVAPFYDQIRKIIWDNIDNDGRRFVDYIPPALVEKQFESRMAVLMKNGSLIRFGGSDNPDSLVGGNPIGIVQTEASLHKPEAWDYLRPILSDNGGWTIMNGTPRGMNHFYARARAAQADPDAWFYQYLTRDDTGYPSLEAINQDRKDGMPEWMIQQEYYCNWTASTDDVFIPLDIVSPCTARILDLDAYRQAPKVMGIDVAFAENGDRAAIARRQGKMLFPMLSYKGKDNHEFALLVDKAIQEFHPDAVYIDAGRGEGVYTKLWYMPGREYRDLVFPVNFGGTSHDKLYANKRAVMMGRFKKWFIESPIPSIPMDIDLIKDITTPFLIYDDQKSVIKLESKKAMKSRGVGSPDLLDACILTFAENEMQLDNLAVPEQLTKMGITSEMYRMMQSNMGKQSRTVDDSYRELFPEEGEDSWIRNL